jgi:hypothetical protein
MAYTPRTTADKYSFRPHPVSEKTILYKLTVLDRTKERYVIVAKPDGSHYEEHVPRPDAIARFDAEERAFRGALGGHVPQPVAVRSEQTYSLRRTYVSPKKKILEGTKKTEAEWRQEFPDMIEGDCARLHQWFFPSPLA